MICLTTLSNKLTVREDFFHVADINVIDTCLVVFLQVVDGLVVGIDLTDRQDARHFSVGDGCHRFRGLASVVPEPRDCLVVLHRFAVEDLQILVSVSPQDVAVVKGVSVVAETFVDRGRVGFTRNSLSLNAVVVETIQIVLARLLRQHVVL